jgi:hypothetical protein
MPRLASALQAATLRGLGATWLRLTLRSIDIGASWPVWTVGSSTWQMKI